MPFKANTLSCYGVVIGILFACLPGVLHVQAQEEVTQEEVRSKVLEVRDEGYRSAPGTSFEVRYQTLGVEILEGDERGNVVEVESDLYELSVGDRLFLTVTRYPDGSREYRAEEPDRRGVLLFFVFLFIAAVLSFGFWKGVRSLVSLAISFTVIIFLLLPRLLEGASPIPTTILFASLILFSAMYITHGFNRITHAAFLGTIVTVAFVGFLAYLGVTMGHLSGFASHEALYLDLQTGGLLDISGLLLAAIIVGILGVLDDVSITQAATVRELRKAAPQLSRLEIYRRALAVGKEHIVSLVNTIALAYAGAALPLLLLLSQREESLLYLMNLEIFATEIIRTLAGSIGLIAAVPITTALAVLLLNSRTKEDEKEAEGGHHHHHHAHL